jgi:hypothetical protein
MKISFIEILISFFLLTSCNNFEQKKTFQTTNPIPTYTVNRKLSETKEIICDSILKNKRYKITVSKFSEETNYDSNVFNAIFRFYEMKNGKYQELYQDSIQNHFIEIKFEDFNNDKVKDILVENISDVRSNLTYYLYLVDTVENRLKKIKGFEEIKNPHYISRYNLIDNMVYSGRNWTSFYKIQGDSVKDFNIIIYDGENSKGLATYDKDYKKALNKILSIEKNNW